MSGPAPRLVGTLVCLILLTGGGRGLCFMNPAPSARPETSAAAHDCCKKGLSGKAPACCHSRAVPNVWATAKKSIVVALLAFSTYVLAPASEPALHDPLSSRRPGSHSPPALVLRI
jgi:hypothetical protein